MRKLNARLDKRDPVFLAMRAGLALLSLLVLAGHIEAQERLPIFDVHLHALAADALGPPPQAICSPFDPMPVWDQTRPYPEVWTEITQESPSCHERMWSPTTEAEIMTQTLEVMERLNVFGVLSGSTELVATWRAVKPERLVPGLLFNLADPSAPSPDALRSLFEQGAVQVLGEITNQYAGIAPDDERMAPYWDLAEELDIPVGIHVGTGPPGVIYLGDSGYRARLHSALTIEEVLVEHPRLRVYLMHAGYPMLDDLLTLLYSHPQVYVGLGVIAFTQPRAAFYRYLRGIVESGFGNRVMFGSDQMVWPEAIDRSVAVIREAPFLSDQQERDILYNNAARFFRLSEERIAQHHDM